MLCDTNLTKTTFTKNTADLVFFFDIFDPLESFEVFEVQDVKEAALGRKTIFCDLSREWQLISATLLLQIFEISQLQKGQWIYWIVMVQIFLRSVKSVHRQVLLGALAAGVTSTTHVIALGTISLHLHTLLSSLDLQVDLMLIAIFVKLTTIARLQQLNAHWQSDKL